MEILLTMNSCSSSEDKTRISEFRRSPTPAEIFRGHSHTPFRCNFFFFTEGNMDWQGDFPLGHVHTSSTYFIIFLLLISPYFSLGASISSCDLFFLKVTT